MVDKSSMAISEKIPVETCDSPSGFGGETAEPPHFGATRAQSHHFFWINVALEVNGWPPYGFSWLLGLEGLARQLGTRLDEGWFRRDLLVIP